MSFANKSKEQTNMKLQGYHKNNNRNFVEHAEILKLEGTIKNFPKKDFLPIKNKERIKCKDSQYVHPRHAL